MTDEQELWDLVASRREGVLATIARDGTPQLSNVLYVVDPASRMVRISTTDDRAKARNLARDPRASMHVAGDNFWQYAVMTGAVSLSAVAATRKDGQMDRPAHGLSGHFEMSVSSEVVAWYLVNSGPATETSARVSTSAARTARSSILTAIAIACWTRSSSSSTSRQREQDDGSGPRLPATSCAPHRAHLETLARVSTAPDAVIG